MHNEIIILDTNILIDYLEGRSQAKRLLAIYAEKNFSVMISIITLIDINAQEQKDIYAWLMAFSPIHVCSKIANVAVQLRQNFKLKVPDAVIASTAQVHHGMLVTRDRDFKNLPGVQYPYHI